MGLFVNITLDGIANGMIFAALALALVLIFRATRIVNFAQGAMGMITTFIASSLLGSRASGTGGPSWRSWSIGFVLGALVERVLIRPLQGKSELNPVIVTIGLLVVLEGLAGTIYGNSSRGFPAAYSQSGLTVGHTKIAFSHFDVFILVAVLVLMTATLVLFRATTLGLRMRASAFAGEISRLLGVRVGLLLTLGWALAGVAGIVGGSPRRADELVRALLHGPRPGLRLHRRGDRRARESCRRVDRRAHHRTVHLLRRWLPGVGPAAPGRPGPAHGGPHGPARRDLRPTAGPESVR